MPNPYIIGGIVALAVGAAWKTYHMGYTAGADAVTSAYAESMAIAQEKEKDNVKEIIKWKIKKEVVYRDRIKTIKIADDPIGCLDADLSDAGLGGMLRADSDKARPIIDDAN